MKKKMLVGLALGVMTIGVAANSNATTLTFDTDINTEITLGGNMLWNGTGGGHLYNEGFYGDDSIIFNTGSVYINDFQINAMPWENYGGGDVGMIDIAALDASGNTIWNTTANLTDYTDWSNWLTISVETANVAQLYFTAPGNAPHYNGFWPSVDNLRINENANPVPEPATMLLFGTGLAGLVGARLRRKK